MPEKKNLHYMARKTTANIDIAASKAKEPFLYTEP